jgi:ribosomal protein S4
MILIIKKKNRFYRKYQKDLWGLCFTDYKATEKNKNFKKSWIIRFFLKIYKKRIERRWKRLRRYIYRIDIIDLRYRKKKYNKRWLSIRFTRLYFLTLQDHQFRQLFKKAQKLTGNLNTNYCYLLEGRLLPIFYRTNFLASLFVIINFIKNKNVLINFKKITYVNTLINIGSFITFRKKLKRYMFSFLYKRILVKAILFNRPRYLFISYKYAFAYIFKKLKKKDLVYPISLDIQRISGYY